MPVVMLFALLAIIVGTFVVAIGRGGELAVEQVDHAPVDLGLISPTDVALLRPPTTLWGYNMQVTDTALDQIARALRDRDIEIAYLQRQLADLGYSDYDRPRDFVPKHERPAIAPPEPAAIEAPAETDEAPADPSAEEQAW
ncbi:MAG TPA: hypothetical protein VKU39_05710 [Streptosporangiaceae bacterium]|nr:hypothetical protein [Streptosporangiaceae bacterium]